MQEKLEVRIINRFQLLGTDEMSLGFYKDMFPLLFLYLDVMHLAATYMLSRSINHGINLEHQVSLQYLYYLDQVGLSLSPLSNNFLFKKIRENPFPKLFKRGLNVTLSTDDPLLFHMSDDALLEE